MMIKRTLADERQTIELGSQLATALHAPLVIYLQGDLGMGKTTFTRGLVQALGHQGAVKSPTYALVESYEFNAMRVFHFDLYRLQDPEELEFMGIRDYFTDDCVCLVEWPERGFGLLPPADLDVELRENSDGGRDVMITARTSAGETCLKKVVS
ncbi:tRNA (adenosine(37)-N6)-threonylcarbamoyltransferase complex ATPase subunit type 1 TsaE [Aliidiomarina soli]|uniref:tRNA threonylcarbamoyladenosine biosynthesis protein TsaE n=1 Tax=Aliidiomarina soli TaxID=1928574 RepID=A0A432WJP2_9GAMM|nr:tRNA (adenosine(37)-N6)-threonylcarbamoyltransferase complex ATPase subunit type 1 TsaE [Aliidiomarina soli]